MPTVASLHGSLSPNHLLHPRPAVLHTLLGTHTCLLFFLSALPSLVPTCPYPTPPHPPCQVMVTKEVASESGFSLKDLVPTSTAVLIEGELTETPPGTKQKV